MFRQLVMPGGLGGNPTAAVMNNINSLFIYHPLQISSIIETVWFNRNQTPNAPTSSAFVPWAPQISRSILNTDFPPGLDWTNPAVPSLLPHPTPPLTFIPPLQQPGIVNSWDGVTTPITSQATNWDHMMYAYVIENTRIYEIFSKVLGTYMFSEQLETPSAAGQLFWRNLEFLIYGDAMPSMFWTTSSRLRRDEVADRLTAYFWLFGIDLAHAGEIVAKHPYAKPAAANRDFIPTFEAFAREVWRAIMNARNTSGPNDTDPSVIATLARRIYDMMETRRLNGNLSREEFRAVAIMSWLHIAVLYDSPAVVDLKAEASSPEMRLQKIAERVGLTIHPKTKPFFDLAAPFSFLLQSIETGAYNDPANVPLLYQQPPTVISANAETVIDQYSLATGRDLKSVSVSIAPRASAASMPVSRPQVPPRVLTPTRVNGQSVAKQ